VFRLFPSQIRGLVFDSKEEVEFRNILTTTFSMILIAGRMKLVELVFSVLREDLQSSVYTRLVNEFFADYLRANFCSLPVEKQLNDLNSSFAWFSNQALDYSLVENVRFAVVHKLLVLMLRNSAKPALTGFFI